MKAQVRWERIGGGSCLLFHFGEGFSVKDAEETINDASSALDGVSDPVTMVWDCRTMNDYDVEARNLWQEFIKGLKPRIGAIHLISDKLVIRMAATTMGIFAGIRVQAWKCMTEIPFQALGGQGRPLSPPDRKSRPRNSIALRFRNERTVRNEG